MSTRKEKLEEYIQFLRKDDDGKNLEVWIRGRWEPGVICHASFSSFQDHQWRVKPDAPKVQPWTFETAPDFAVKAKRKESGNQGLLVFLPNGCLFMMGSGIHDPALALQYDYKRATEELEQLDGSPCGIEQKEESEWPKYMVACGDRGYIYRGDSENGPITQITRDGRMVNEPRPDLRYWSSLFHDSRDVEIPAAEAERIMSEAKEGVTK